MDVKGRAGNPWAEEVGCEVNYCEAEWCDKGRVQWCALRKVYRERVAYLRNLLRTTRRAAGRARIKRELRGLAADE